MENIKVIFWGLGVIGSEMARMTLDKEGLEIVGAIDKEKSKVGLKLSEYLNYGNSYIVINNNPIEILKSVEADIVILAIDSDSFVESIFPKIKLIIQNKINCIIISEEMIYPNSIESNLSKELDDLAKINNVTVLGTGINTGFMLNSLIMMLTASYKNIKSIRASRVTDLSGLGRTIIKSQGVGTTIQEFEKGTERGTIKGQIGFAQSISMIANTLGLRYDEIVESKEPIISNTYRETDTVIVHPGMVAGCNHIAIAYRNNKKVIALEHTQQIYPQCEGFETGDYIDIYGNGNLHLCITQDICSNIGTAAVAINMIPQVLSSKSGLKTMIDMQIPHVIENNFVDQLKYYLK